MMSGMRLSIAAISLSFAASLFSDLAAGPPGAPRLLAARPEDGRVTLSFTPAEGAAWYRVRIAGPGGRERTIDRAEAIPYSVQGLPGDDFRFSVRAVAADGTAGPESNVLEARPVAEPPWPVLREAFSGPHPFRCASPFTMVHGNESDEELRATIRAAHAGGFEGVTLHPYNYEDYLGPGQWSRWRTILEQAERLGIVVWQQDDRNYPSGFAGGKVVAAHPEFARRTLAEAAARKVRGPDPSFVLEWKPLAAGEEFMAASAFSAGREPVDLTERAQGTRLAWEVPPGEWEVIVLKSVRDPGPYIDFLNPAAVDAYIDAVYGATFRELGAHFGRTFKGFFSDEAPVDFRQWTPDFLERFRAARGWSIRPWLPAVLRDLPVDASRARHDWRHFIREENSRLFFGRSRDWCRAHGIRLVGHVIEDHMQDQRRLEFLDLGGMDQVFGHWWDPDPDVYWRCARMASSVSHYCGVPGDLALVEHFAATGWRTGLTEMKRMMDWTTAFGLNVIVPCGLDTGDPPVWEDAPEFWLHGKNPQWPYFPEYQASADRLAMMMRGGRHVAPAVVLDTTESCWLSHGADLGSQHGARDDLWRTVEALCRAQIDHDLVPSHILADPARAAIDGGRLRIAREEYRAAVVPPVERVAPEVLERLAAFAEAGGAVVAVGRPPERSTDGAGDDRARAAAARIWKAGGPPACAVAKDLAGVAPHLRGLGLDDVRLSAPATNVLGVHRRLLGRDLYFFACTAPPGFSGSAWLRGAAGGAEAWDPTTGRIAAIGSRGRDGGLEVPLHLDDGESVFFVVDPEASPARPEAAAPPALAGAIPIPPARWSGVEEGPYRRRFRADADLPADWPQGAAARLRLDGVTQVVEVEVNGRPAGRRFAPPYVFEIGEALRPGTNRIAVLHVERWLHEDPPGIDDRDLSYHGAWTADAYPPSFGPSRHYTKAKGASVEGSFRGTGVAWIGERNADRGKARVSIDGGPPATVDTWNGGGPEAARATLFEAKGLADGPHRIRIECLGEKSEGSRDSFISVDGLRVRGGPAAPPWTAAAIERFERSGH